MTILCVRECGPMTSLQDGGRSGMQRFGVSRSGAMDGLALAHANVLVGNEPSAGAIELMLAGATFQVAEGTARIAFAGAGMSVRIGDAALPPGKSATVGPGDVVAIGPARTGLFGYLAVAGGIAVNGALGSVSLQSRAAIGGFGGRPFRAGDRIPLRADGAPDGPQLALPPPPLEADAPIRVVLGPQDDHFDADAIATFLGTAYRVSAEADRMGFRLEGPPIGHLLGFNIVSDGIVAGSIQVPGSGVPILNMADHQTTGGYPKIATIVSADMRVIGQRRPGDTVRFAAIPVEAAQALARDRAALIEGLAAHARPGEDGLPGSEILLGLNLAGAATDALAADA